MWRFSIFLICIVTIALGQDAAEDNTCAATDGIGECVPYYLCTDNNTINTDGESIIDVRFQEECEKSLEVCCGSEKIVPDRPDVDPPSSIAKCGVINTNGVNVRILGSKENEAQFGEFPWMVALLKELTSGDQVYKVYQCGGALIHPKVVITAAHCVYNLSSSDKIFARAGEWDTQNTNEPIAHQEELVQRITIHEDFKRANLFNDVAFLLLKNPMTLSPAVNVACLPEVGDDVDPTSCFVTGWGKNEFSSKGRYQVILKKVDLPIVPRKECQKNLRKTRLGRRFILDRSFVCAGGVANKDVCTGDGGSPLVCPIPGKKGHYSVSGLVAWGIGCGDAGIPGVYVNVPLFVSWISEQLLINDVDVDIYKP